MAAVSDTITVVRLLIVEDNPGDIALLRIALGDVRDMRFELVAVDTVARAIERLRETAFDVVFVKLMLPTFDDTTALAEIRAHAPNVAIIALAGVEHYDLGVAAIEAGAHDYLLKDRLDGHTVERAVRHSLARRRLEARLREREAEVRALFDYAPFPTWVYDLETLRFLAVNEVAIEVYGHSREDFLAMTIADIRPLDEKPILQQRLARGLRRREPGERWIHRTRDGTELHVIVYAQGLRFRGRDARIVVARPLDPDEIA